MAFTEPTNQDLVAALQNPSQTQYGYNLLRRSTLGSTDLFREIAATASFSGAVLCTNSQSDSIGRLDIGTSNPTLVKRYKLLEIIGEGTFSQIFKAEDIYSCKTVAIKVMRIGFHVLGMRETTFLRHFNGRELRGAQHCKFIGNLIL
jgi:serine/threonine protein kinase